MKIPIPCELGEKDKDGNILTGVMWFHWSSGYEFTFHYKKEGSDQLCNIKTKNYWDSENYLEIDDALLEEHELKMYFPLRGKGYVCGIDIIDGKYYAEIILTSKCLAHIKVECTSSGHYDGGKVRFPPTPSFDTIEKRERVLIKKYQYLAKG